MDTPQDDTLARIAKSVESIRHWIVFWSLLTILGFLVSATVTIALIVNAASDA